MKCDSVIDECRRVRRYLGLTQTAVSLGTGIRARRLSRAESGRGTLNATEMQALRLFLAERLKRLRVLDIRDYAPRPEITA